MPAHDAPILEIRGLTKDFGTTTVLHGIDLDVHPGDLVGLTGPNGAGKSTLIKILDGLYRASQGTIRFAGEPVDRLRGRPDVGFIHQDLGLVDELTVMENLRLGAPPLRRFGPILHGSAERADAVAALRNVGMEDFVDATVGGLSPGQKTLVAIARPLARGARLLFVDEATSTLPPGESTRVIRALAALAERGTAVIMVTHKLSEILDAARRIVIIVDGRIAADQPTRGMDREALVALVDRREAVPALAGTGAAADRREPGRPLITMRGAYGGAAGPVDLELRAGEVCGLTGLPGSGLHDIAFLANGTLKPRAGRVERAPGVRTAIVPPYRETQGGFGELAVRENMAVSSLSRWSRGGLLAVGRERREAQAMVERLSVEPRDAENPYGPLSGGNKQKAIFGRALFRAPDMYVLCEPTRGIDVRTRRAIYELIRELPGPDTGVLVVSSDAEDLFGVCDRVGVVEDGRALPPRPTELIELAELEAMV